MNIRQQGVRNAALRAGEYVAAEALVRRLDGKPRAARNQPGEQRGKR